MKAFDRLPNETLEEYELFLAYARQSPGNRLISTVANQYGLDERYILELSERNAWIERAAALDRYNAIEWQRAANIKASEARYLTMAALAAILQKLIAYLQGVDPSYFSLDEMKVLLDWSDKAARIAQALKGAVEDLEPDVEEVLTMARHLQAEE